MRQNDKQHDTFRLKTLLTS